MIEGLKDFFPTLCHQQRLCFNCKFGSYDIFVYLKKSNIVITEHIFRYINMLYNEFIMTNLKMYTPPQYCQGD